MKREIAKLLDLGACEESIEWLSAFSSAREAWEACGSSAWMFWLLRELPIDTRLLVQIAVACAKRALVRVPDGEVRPANAISLVERWLAGEAVTRQELLNAASDAAAAASASYAAASASYAASYAASSAASYATSATASATYAAGAASYAASYATEQREQCKIIRAIVSYGTVAELLERTRKQ